MHYINTGAQEEALEIYRKIVNTIERMELKPPNKLRYLKNYLISLNSIIYMNCRKRLVCVKKLMEMRSKIMEQIERQDTWGDAVLLGAETIKEYLIFYSDHLSQMNNPIIHDALDYIKENLDKELSLEEVASAIHVSKSHLSNLFTKCIGNSFSHHVNKLRIEKAKELLANTKLSLMDITVECGFNSQSYFSRVFSGFEGMTPYQYRKLYRTTKNDNQEAL